MASSKRRIYLYAYGEIYLTSCAPNRSSTSARNRSKSSVLNEDRTPEACANKSGSGTSVQDAKTERSRLFASKYITRSSPQFSRRLTKTNLFPRSG